MAPKSGSTATLTWSVSPGQVYYIGTSSNDDTYGLEYNLGSYSQAPIPSSIATAIDTWPLLNQNTLQVAIPGLYVANNADQQWFRVFVPWNTSGQMTVTMQSTNLSSLSPRVALFDSNGYGLTQASALNVYGATVGLTYSVSPGQVYYIRASSAGASAGGDGSYGLEINLGSSSQAPIAPPNTAVAAQPDQGGGATSETIGGIAAGRPARAADSIAIGNLIAAGEAMTVSPAFGARHPGLNPLHLRSGGSGGHHVQRGPIGTVRDSGNRTAAHDRAPSDLGGRHHIG